MKVYVLVRESWSEGHFYKYKIEEEIAGIYENYKQALYTGELATTKTRQYRVEEFELKRGAATP